MELAYDNEPALAAGMSVAQALRAAQGLETFISLGRCMKRQRRHWQKGAFRLSGLPGVAPSGEDACEVCPLRAW